MKYKTKEFKGNSIVRGGGKNNKLDVRINDWLERKPNIKIISYQYSTPDKDNSSALILYEVVSEKF